jgi:hypothetical protein
MACERLAQMGDASNVHRLIARVLVVVRGHEDDGALRSRCRKPTPQLKSRNSPKVDVEQQAGCRLHAVAFEQSLGRGERPAVDAFAPQQPRNALQKAPSSSTTITTVVGCAIISMSIPRRVLLPTTCRRSGGPQLHCGYARRNVHARLRLHGYRLQGDRAVRASDQEVDTRAGAHRAAGGRTRIGSRQRRPAQCGGAKTPK